MSTYQPTERYNVFYGAINEDFRWVINSGKLRHLAESYKLKTTKSSN